MTASTITRNQPARPDVADPLTAPMPDWTRAACHTWGTTTATTGICGGVWLEDGQPTSMPTRTGGSRGRIASPVRRPA